MRQLFAAGVLSICFLVAPRPAAIFAAPDDAAPAAADSDDVKQRQAAERFLGVLEKSPRRGTALDRLYGYHIEAGTLEQFVRTFEERTAKNAKDGAAWMILGLIEAQRGRDAAAVAAFTQAMKTLPENPLAAYYLGQSLVLVGQPDEAAAAFEQAIARKPPRADLLEMFQALGRVYQRAQKGDQALAVWSRLEKLFPDDLRVQEQIATTLVEEGQHGQALPRFEALAAKVKDEYRAATYRVEAADLKVRLGQSKEALADFETLLGKLNPENWLYRDVRRRIDDVFLRTDDQTGLAAYYETWVEKNPDDVDAMGRLARILASLGRTPEAQTWLDKALKLAPSRKDLRLALIEQMLADKQFGRAIEQYELLAKNDPNNPDTLRDWGRLILKDTSKPEAERKKAAAAVWRRLVEARPKDSLTATQVADLFRQSELVDEAIALYKKAIELSPDAAQYREYLGEYYHSLKRSDEALAVWREIVAGKKHTAENLARLAEVLAGFGYLEEGVGHILEACRIDNDEFKYPLKAAEMLSRSEKYDDALKQLDAADKLADSPENAEMVLQQRIRNLQLADKLEAQVAALQKDLAGAKPAKEPARWYLLARYLESARKLPEADQAIGRALALDEKSVLYRGAAARIAEASGKLQNAADAYRVLASIDRRFRTEHLTNVAKLETQLGRVDQALQAGKDLLAAAPGNPENHEFFAQLCFQLGKNEEGLDALRRSVRLNPTEPKGMLTLAAALSDQFRTDEAIELYWRAFEKSTDIDGKLGVVAKLAELYLQTNHFDRLVERFERQRREASQEREMTICLAQAYQSAGDYGTARQELERLLTQNTRDTQLLQQLSKLAETEGDLTAAAKYQQQLLTNAPGKENQMRLAQLLMRSGETDEASNVWVRLMSDETEPEKVLPSIDSLLAHDKRDTALLIIERLLRDQPKNWELLYRAGAALANEKPDEAAARFDAILALRLPDDEPGVQVQARARQVQSRPPTASARNAARFQAMPLQQRIQHVYQLRSLLGFDSNRYYGGQSQTSAWGPHDFGMARMAALAWLLQIAEKSGKQEDFIAQRRQLFEAPAAEPRELWDWFYLQEMRQDHKEVHEAARRLSRSDDPLAQWIYLTTLPNRSAAGGRRVARSNQNQGDSMPALPGDEIDHLLSCYKSLKQKRPELAGGGIYGNQIASAVMAELKRAQRTDEENAIYRDVMTAADRPESRQLAMQLATDRGDYDAALALFEKMMDEELAQAARTTPAYYGGLATDTLMHLMANRAEAGALPDAMKLFDRYLSYVQRQKETAAKSAPAGRRTTSQQNYRSMYGYSVYVGKTRRNVQFDYPQPNEYYDHGFLSLLRQAFELYKTGDVTSDLFAHFGERAENSPESARVFWRLGLSYLHWWNDEQEQSTAMLGRALELVPADLTLRMDVVEMQERRGDFEEALKTVEAIAALDHQAMQQRETAALRLSVRTGDVDRARLAAERLFGLRLDSEIQVQLAAEMRQLGMHEHAEAVLARARRQAGNRVGALVSLMTQYQVEQKSELAVQVAHQILRRGGPALPGPNRVYREDDAARPQALQVLARSGKLKELIERSEAQLKASPGSTHLYQSLVEYYKAAGDQAKSLEALKKMASLRPDDARLQYQIGQQMAQSGKPADAIEYYKNALKKEPALFGNSGWQVQQAFQQANKNDDLVKLLDEMDFKTMGNYWSVMNIIQNMMNQNMMNNDQQHETTLKLFRKAWQAFPNDRASMLGNIHRDEFWKLPEIYDYARQATIPSDAVALNDPWGAVSQVLSYSGDGKVSGLITRLIEAALKQNRLPDLKTEIEQGLQKFPGWLAGKALLAVIHVRSGKPELAKSLLDELLADKKNPVPVVVCWVVGQEFDAIDATRPLAQKLYESTVDQQEQQLDYSYSPMRRLVGIYQKSGETTKAYDLLMKLSRQKDNNNGYDPNYAAYQKIEQVGSLGTQLVELGYPIDAIRLYSEVLDNDEVMQAAKQFGDTYTIQQAREGYAKAQQAFKPETLSRTLTTLLAPRKPADKHSDGSALDLVLIVHPRELGRAELNGLLGRALREGAGSNEIKQVVNARIADLLVQYPDDFSVQIAAALAAFNGGAPDSVRIAIQRLQTLAERTPLELLPAGTRANARQRTEAARQIGLWLVARECLKSADHGKTGTQFAQRALDAARRQSDRKFALAILREWGQTALDQGDKKTAEARWTEMLELVLPPPVAPKASAALKREDGRWRMEDGEAQASAVRTAAFRPRSSIFHLPSSSSVVRPRSSILHPLSSSSVVRPRSSIFHPPSSSSVVRPRSSIFHPPSSSSVVRPRSSILHPLSSISLIAQVAPKKTPSPTPATQPQPPRGPTLPPATLTQFNQAAEIAALAADKGMVALSLRAVREALRAGPPVIVQAPNPAFGAVSRGIRRNNPDDDESDPTSSYPQVARKLTDIVALWKKSGIPYDQQYDVLAAAVFPEGRPAEIFLYPAALAPQSATGQKSVGKLLAMAAVKAGRTADLKSRIDARLKQPLSQLTGRVLMALLALETGDVPLANNALAELHEQLENEATQNSFELACHPALAALTRDELADAALPLVELAAEHAAAETQVHGAEPAARLLMVLARHHLKHGDSEAGNKALAEYLEAYQRDGARYGGGDYGAYRYKTQMAVVILELARAGSTPEALEILGRYADLPSYRNYGEESLGPALHVISKYLLRLPAQERYELLKPWTLPTETRQAVRILGSFTAIDNTPAAFSPLAAWNRRPGEDPAQRTAIATPPAAAQVVAERAEPKQSEKDSTAAVPTASDKFVVSTADLLIDAARETNRLDELAAAANDAADKKLNQAQALAWLVAMARGDTQAVEAGLKQLAVDYPSRLSNPNQRPPLEWTTYLAARAAIRHKPLRETGESLIGHMKRHAERNFGNAWLSRLHYDRGASIAVRNPSEILPGQDPGAVLWHTASVGETVGVPNFWLIHEDHIAHIAGPGDDFLLFDYPVVGEFEFSVDAVCRGWGEANFSYAGLVFEPLHLGSPTELWPVGRHETLDRPDPVEKTGDVFNRLTLQVKPNRIRCLCNGHLACEDASPSPTSPWLALFAEHSRDARWCNVTLTGDLRIPREVRLAQGDRLDGWVVTGGGNRPPRLTLGTTLSARRGNVVVGREVDPNAYTWSSREGVITSRVVETVEATPAAADEEVEELDEDSDGPVVGSAAASARESRLYYFRPLRDGETLRYDFFYESGVSEVHPALDRLAFLLRPEGVRMHWVNDASGGFNDWNGLADDNMIDEPQFRSGTGKLPFKARDWNSVRLSLVDNVAVLELNGVEICRRPLEPTNSRQFGLYHRSGETAVQVRSVVLSGNWPERLSADQLANLMARVPDKATPTTRRARNGIMEEKFFAAGWEFVQKRAQAMDPEARYTYLKSWVLAGPDHPSYRLIGAGTPADPIPVAGNSAATPAAAAPAGLKRIHSGGEITAPVLDLIAVARELNKLDEVAKQTLAFKPAADFGMRGKFAILALVAMAQNNDQAAAGYIEQLRPLQEKMPDDAPEQVRWPEYIVAAEAIKRPALRARGLDLLEIMVKHIQTKYLTWEWERRIRPLRDRARYLSLADANPLPYGPYGADPTVKQWSRVTHGTAQTRGQGMSFPHWQTDKGEVRHFAGHDSDFLYFNTPLRGNFEVNCQLTTFGWREAGLSYAGATLKLIYTRDKFELSQYGKQSSQVSFAPTLPGLGDWYDYRLVVQDGSFISYMQGQKVYEQRIPANPDPWLALHSFGPYAGGMRHVKITGNPEIPESIDLSEKLDLGEWIANYYSESIDAENANWRKEGSQIVGSKMGADAAGSARQSLLKYHRPLLEDGEIEYEFYYDPGSATPASHVHPALDRLTFILEPTGVRIHWLTDAQFDRTGLLPDNVFDEPAHRRGPKTLPLKERDWNQIKLALKGDVVSLSLNGVEIYERPLEATNQRIFGLFHYSSETEVHVRNVTYRGTWPRTLPPLAEQELAIDK